MDAIDRRRFLKSSAALAALAALRPRPGLSADPPKRAVQAGMLPGSLPLFDRFALAVEAGFAGVEMPTVADPAEAARIGEAAARAGLRIHAVVNTSHRLSPLSSADPGVARQGVAGVGTSLANARLWGADAVLITPAVAEAGITYREARHRSLTVLRERLVPLAREHRVALAVERVWDGFLLGPVEFARYLDDAGSSWVKAGFDMGSVVFYAYPQDWIRGLGRRLATIRLRDFRFARAGGDSRAAELGEGDVDWPEVRRALADVGYVGWLTVEAAGDGATRLGDAAARLGRLVGA